jgi:hypothetical protein
MVLCLTPELDTADILWALEIHTLGKLKMFLTTRMCLVLVYDVRKAGFRYLL